MIFQKLLCAVYNRPYKLNTARELFQLANLADFYCSCPIVSATLTAALVGSPMFMPGKDAQDSNFARYAVATMMLARKFRHALRFRECFVHVVGRWDIGEVMIWSQHIREDPVLSGLIFSAHAVLVLGVLKASQWLLADSIRSIVRRHNPGLLDYNKPPTATAAFYRAVQNRAEMPNASYEWGPLRVALEDVLKSSLVLDKSGFGAGQGPYADYLLSASIKDEELPWDPNEID